MDDGRTRKKKGTARDVLVSKRTLPPPSEAAVRQRPRLETIREGSITLRLTEAALRSRCRRAYAKRDADGNAVIAPGVFAIKIGKHWRIKYV